MGIPAEVHAYKYKRHTFVFFLFEPKDCLDIRQLRAFQQQLEVADANVFGAVEFLTLHCDKHIGEQAVAFIPQKKWLPFETTEQLIAQIAKTLNLDVAIERHSDMDMDSSDMHAGVMTLLLMRLR